MKLPYDGKLAIFTSFNSYHAYAPYVISLAQTLGVLSRLDVNWDYLARPADFHIERALNNTLTELMERDDFTDVLLIDSDESWEPQGVVRLLMHPEEIVGGTYRMKNMPEKYVGSIWPDEDGDIRGKKLPDGSYLLRASRVAAGFMRIKISALRKWAAAYPDLISEEPDGRKVQFFSRMIAPDGEGGKPITHCQDMAFCKRWIEIGGELWVDPMVKVHHWWMTCYPGDYDRHLRGVAEGSKALAGAKDAIAMVQKMAAEIQNR